MLDYHMFHKDGIAVELEWIGEGVDGEFDDSDPTDYPHLRFTVLKCNGEEFVPLDDASYCTLLNANSITADEADSICRHIWTEVVSRAQSGMSIKKTCERLSHISPP